MPFASFSCLPPIGRLFFRWVRASAPTGCSPRDSGRLFAIGSDLLYLLLLFLAFLLSGDFSSGGCTQAHQLGVVPEIRADCLQSVWIFFTCCFFFLPSSYRETFLPVGARKRTNWV